MHERVATRGAAEGDRRHGPGRGTDTVPALASPVPGAVAVAGLATGLRRRAVGDLRAAPPAARGLAPLRRQAARAGTVRRMQATADATATEPTPLPTGLKITVALSSQEMSARTAAMKNAAAHAEQDAESEGMTTTQIKERIVDAEAATKAQHTKDPAPFEAHLALPVQEAWLAGGNLDITSHWELLLRYGDDTVQRWVKIDLTSADGYRMIWAVEPRKQLRPLPITGTVGAVVDVAREVAARHPLYYNPAVTDVNLVRPRYSCQHFVAEIAAVYGTPPEPFVKL